jgi:DNA-directed RNA polymerase specialized sigma24 family protein
VDNDKAARFFAEWERVKDRVRGFCIGLTGTVQYGKDLYEKTYDALLFERTAWDETRPLLTQACWCAKGLRANQARLKSALVLRKKDEDPEVEPPPDSGRAAERSETAATLERICRKFFADLRDGTVEKRVAMHAKTGDVSKVSEVAKALGVTPRQVTEAIKSLKRKFKELLAEENLEVTDLRGVSLAFMEDDGD